MNNEQQRLILPTFYPYPFRDGETPLDVMTRLARQAEAEGLQRRIQRGIARLKQGQIKKREGSKP